MNNADYQTYWTLAVADYKKVTGHTDNANFPSGSFLKIWNRFFNYLASNGRPIAAGDSLLHYLHSGKKKAYTMSPQSFYTRFQKVLRAVKLLDHCYEKELDDNKAKLVFSYAFHMNHIQDYVHHGQHNFDNEMIEDLKIFFKAILMMPLLQKLTNPTIVVPTEASLLVVAVSHSPIVTTPILHLS